ncbi:MAG TPA: alkaline phosphatase family protein [Gemmatimonadaceae bacterium]|nr:alkaline phosphatase family protein [Gemmatimonadaceae bacterium]
MLKSVRWVGIVAGLVPSALIGQTQRPTLVVAVTIDQMRPDYVSGWATQLTGGLARFWRDGAFFVSGFQDHANTETAPGHASILSGRFPYSTGIIANSLGVNTPDAPLIESADAGASPFRFRGTTLADWLHAKDSSARVLSVSRKDRSAILPVAPAHSHTVIWYSPRTTRFTTSSWYGTTIPSWVREFNAERGVLALAGRTWDLLLAPSEYPEPDSVAAETRTPVFPHAIPTDSARVGTAVVNSPWMDSLTLALALRGVGAMSLGAASNRTDLLAVSLSSTDAVGHRWGPDSRELHDQVLRVDRYLGVFMDSLIALRGRDRVVFVLTADHGVAPSPELRSRFGDNAGATRVQTALFRPLVSAARARLRAAGLDTTALRWEDLVLWIDRNALKGAPFDADALSRWFADSVRTIPGVLRADVIDHMTRVDTTTDAIARRWLRMFPVGVESYPGVKALVAVTLKPYLYLGAGDVASHGTPHDYDARVPIAFLGAPFARSRPTTKANVVDIAPTLAAVLGVTPLERLDGRVLREILR